MIITYEQVFGVPLGQEVQESHGVNYTPCPAVKSLKQQLMAHSFFSGNKVGGVGPLYRPWDGNKHEFNRHHAGLAVDIMLNPKIDAEIALGHQLVLLFKRFASVMQWRGLIYQNATIDAVGAALQVNRWTKGGHDDHIHIDWHSSSNAKWRQGVTGVPLRLKNGKVITMPPVDGNRIAETITWTPQAMTNFEGDSTLQQGLNDLMNKHSQGTLTKLNLLTDAGLSNVTGFNVKSELSGNWKVTIGPWNALFVFDAGGTVYWADNEYSPRHKGKWWATQNQVQWKFPDPGDIRTFSVQLPLNRISTKGKILPEGQGFFEMKKGSFGVA